MNLHVEISGTGRDLFLIHGWGMHGGVWAGVVDALSEQFRVHVVDLPGMGHSPACAPYTLAQLTDTVAAALPDDAMVCGWSMGGLVAMQLALSHPGRVERLMLVGATPRFVTGEDWPCGVDAAMFFQFAAQVEQDYQTTMERFLGLQAFGGESTRGLIRLLRERFMERPMPDQAVLHAALQVLLSADLRGEVAQLQQPVLLLHGERDTLAPVAAAHWLVEMIPQAQLQVVTGSAHAPFLSHPAAFVRTLTDFMG